MKKFKKALTLGLSLVLTAALAVAGTLAYLTWQDSDVNVMTTGGVKIQQNEQQRVEADGEFTSELEDFEQGKILMPVTYPDGRTADTVVIGDYTLELSDKEANYVDKIVSVTNTGKSDAFVRTLVAVPTGGKDWEPNPVSANDCWLHWNIPIGYNNYWTLNGTPAFVEVDGIGYYVWEFTHNEAVSAGETTFPSVRGFYMDKKVDNDENGFYMTYDNGTTKRIDDIKYGDTVDVLVISQAVQTAGFESAGAALDEAFGDVNDVNAAKWFGGMEYPVVVSSEEELATALTAASAAKAGDTTIYLSSDVVLTEDWTSISVDGYHGAGIVTLEGQGNTITGLTAPLFDGGFAGNSGIVIRDLTIADSVIKSDDTQGAGAFISCVDSMTTITLENCHLLNSTVDAPEARTGGLVGWTSGYSKQNDGPVKTYVTITDCSVKNCKITGTAVGGINGHAGASDWTFTTIENCTVMNNELISYDDGEWRVGDVIGTANIGEVTINNTTYGGNTLTQENASSQHNDSISELVGRFVPGTTGKLTVDGSVKVAEVSGTNELKKALEGGATTIAMSEGTYDIPSAIAGKTVTLVGTEGTVVDFTKAHNVGGASITFENIKFQGKNENVMNGYGIIHTTGDIVYKNCTFDGAVTNENNANVDYIDCTFTGTGYITSYTVPTIDFVGCTFDKADSRAVLIYSHGDNPVKATIKNCTFKADAKAYTWAGDWTAAIEVDTTNIKTAGTTVTIESCTADDNYNGILRDKSAANAVKAVITVDGVAK